MEDGVFVGNLACKIGYGYSNGPKVRPLAVKAEGMLGRPTEERVLRLDQAERLSPFCAVIKLESKIHDIVILCLCYVVRTE